MVNWLVEPILVPTSVAILVGVFGVVGMGAVRYLWRLVWLRSRLPRGADVRRVLVFGAGEAGSQLVRTMRRSQDSPYLPVGLLDDHHARQNLRLSGIRVLGDRSSIASVAAETEATAVIIAIPSADAALVRELAGLITAASLEVFVLPGVAELVGHSVAVTDVRHPTELDLLGRSVVHIDIDTEVISSCIAGRRVLVTGAGGSIGSELCRQIHKLGPERLIMLDRDESGLHGTQLLLHGHALLEDPDLVVADIRDPGRLDEVFRAVRPDVVFHAAALKHLPLLELHPGEGVKTNVIGTVNVLQAARAAGVERFVNISTDKAAEPCSVLGYTKRIAERVTAAVAAEESGRAAYLSVRFGNVVGSRGSVVATFRHQVESGGPVTVTHPDATRFFMTVQEAVRLVILAGAIGEPGHALVLDMGDPVRIDDVAQQMAAAAAEPVEIHYMGLRPAEKLHEVLVAADEVLAPTSHPMIGSTAVPPLALGRAVALAGVSGTSLVDGLRTLAGLSAAD